MKKKDNIKKGLAFAKLFYIKEFDNVYVVCMEHIEDAIDEFVVEYEQSPDIHELEKVSFTDWKSPSKCEFCDKKPRFLVV